MEADLGTRLVWLAIDHWNTDNPHVHLLVRGVADDGRDLVIARDYISRGLRSRAEDLVSLELGPKPEQEIRSALERDVEAERWTRLDTALASEADQTGIIDLRPAETRTGDPQIRRLGPAIRVGSAPSMPAPLSVYCAGSNNSSRKPSSRCCAR
jgi:type IV secretory pathway VirD2 relaxase